MQFIYHENSGETQLQLNDEAYRYLIKARRQRVDDKVHFRHLNDASLFTYRINFIGKKHADLSLVKSEMISITPEINLHLAWSIIEHKTIEKTLPMLNQLGVEKITFLPADFSQKNIQISFDRLRKILINSCEQCGRSTLMKLEVDDSIEHFLNKNPDTAILDFGGESLSSLKKDNVCFLIGPEGGFSTEERELFEQFQTLSLKTPLILRSECAAIAISSYFNL